MTKTNSVPPGAALVRARWNKPENVARRVVRLVRELQTIAPALNPEQRLQLHAAIDSAEEAAA